jgi:hypothetical protein
MTPLEHHIEWGKYYEQEEQRKMAEREFSDQLYERLAKLYEPYLAPDQELLLTEARKKALTESLKRFRDYCIKMDARCLPASAGIIAAFLDTEIQEGAGHATIARHVEAISEFHKLNESWNPCDDELVKAIMRSTKGRSK